MDEFLCIPFPLSPDNKSASYLFSLEKILWYVIGIWFELLLSNITVIII